MEIYLCENTQRSTTDIITKTRYPMAVFSTWPHVLQNIRVMTLTRSGLTKPGIGYPQLAFWTITITSMMVQMISLIVVRSIVFNGLTTLE